jgi:hypothetical protein
MNVSQIVAERSVNLIWDYVITATIIVAHPNVPIAMELELLKPQYYENRN